MAEEVAGIWTVLQYVNEPGGGKPHMRMLQSDPVQFNVII